MKYFVFIILFFINLGHTKVDSFLKQYTFIKDTFSANQEFSKNLSPGNLKDFLTSQNPRATVVMCSDSRYHTDIFTEDATNDLFIIRNIGNQIKTAKGSVEYGVRYLKTPVLLIVGHSGCGAIKAVQDNYKPLSQTLRRELDSLRFPKEPSLKVDILENVHNQVAYALKSFQKEVAQGTLIIIGTVYDLRNDYGQGYGRLILVNLNGEKDPLKIRRHKLLQGIELTDLAIH